LISAQEYFLLENRSRDADSNGVTITYSLGGNIYQRTWYRDTANFNAYDIDSLYGTIIDVDEFDWSLPGGVNSRTNEWFNGGALVWHIDENVIEANLFKNEVNANPEHRGVDLEEADGSQDIGQSYEFLSPGAGSEDGTALDFWYAGNSAPVRNKKNFFTPTTFPNSNSYAGANSHIYIKDFSPRKSRMTVKIQVGDAQVKMLNLFPKFVNRSFGRRSITVSDVNNDNIPDIVITTDDCDLPKRFDGDPGCGESNIFGWQLNGTSILPNGYISGFLGKSSTFTYGKIATADLDLNTYPDFVIGGTVLWDEAVEPPETGYSIIESSIRAWQFTDSNSDNVVDPLYDIILRKYLLTSPVISDNEIAFGTTNGTVYILNKNGDNVDSVRLSINDSSNVLSLAVWEKSDTYVAASKQGTIGLIKRGQVLKINQLSEGTVVPLAVGSISSTIGKCMASVTSSGYLYLLNGELNNLSGFPIQTSGEILNSPAIADINADGQRDIIVFSGNKIWAINAAGAVLDNFPITVSTNKTILTSPIVADIDADGDVDIVAVTQEGLVVAYDRNGEMANGFPLQAGKNGGSTPAVFPISDGLGGRIGLAVAGDDGYVYAWKTGLLPEYFPPSVRWYNPWPQYMHDAQNTGLVEDAVTPRPRSNEFLPTSLAYNWPNPVGAEHNFKTHIRYFLSENASVEIKILDLAGDLVTTLNTQGIGGLDNEIEWDVSNIESGIYFAHIEANGATKSGVAIIKIAVVK
ncbi:MAG: T9SS type A sorting domain-containing protein, partial [Ignavibacteriae bacterium]|nr:T9SS type A sorting domain-containing protein [Ignavibacteriota bacterium]